MHVRVTEMNVDVPVSDARRIGILAFALPVWHGAQVAIDATMVSPLGRDGQPRGSSARQAGAVLEQAARRKRETTYPELLTARRCRLVVFGIEVGTARRGICSAPSPVPKRGSHQRWSGVVAVAPSLACLARARIAAEAVSRLPLRPG